MLLLLEVRCRALSSSVVVVVALEHVGVVELFLCPELQQDQQPKARIFRLRKRSN
jgi:hypothetical protein